MTDQIQNFGRVLPKINTFLPGPKSKKLGNISVIYEPQSITRISTDRCPIFWKRAAGSNIIDVDGNVFIDCTSGFGVAGVGHTNPSIVKSIDKQSKYLLHSMGDIFPNDVRIALSRKIIDVFGRTNESQVLFANSGSECIEIAIKAALLYSNKPGIIAFNGSFHGQTLGSLNVTGHNDIKLPFNEYLTKHVRFIPYPYPYREGDDDDFFPHWKSCLERIESEIEISRKSSSQIGTIILEPIQGTNGYIIPPDSFIIDLHQLCKKNDVIMIADEIFTGCGRTGKWLAMDHLKVSADIVCIGKILGGGLPISACISRKAIFEAFQSSSFLALHGSTFSGNPLICASALETINQIESGHLLDVSSEKGTKLLSSLLNIGEKYQLIGDVRGRGLTIAIEIVKDKITKEPAPEETLAIINAALKKGVIVLLTRVPIGNVIGLAPPFTITDEQLEYVIDTLDECIANVSIHQEV